MHIKYNTEPLASVFLLPLASVLYSKFFYNGSKPKHSHVYMLTQLSIQKGDAPLWMLLRVFDFRVYKSKAISLYMSVFDVIKKFGDRHNNFSCNMFNLKIVSITRQRCKSKDIVSIMITLLEYYEFICRFIIFYFLRYSINNKKTKEINKK
jgi:hypothetical protein